MNELDVIAIVAQMGSCFFMTGVIAVMQLTHYPSFADIESSRFIAFHGRHSFALGIIAAPAMVLELVSGTWLARNFDAVAVLNLLGIIALWGITFLISAPAHAQLASGFDSTAWSRLVKTNRLRTAIWMARCAVLATWLTTTLRPSS